MRQAYRCFVIVKYFLTSVRRRKLQKKSPAAQGGDGPWCGCGMALVT